MGSNKSVYLKARILYYLSIFNLDKYNIKPIEALVVYDKFRAGIKVTQEILAKFNEEQVVEEILSGCILDFYTQVGLEEFIKCLKSKELKSTSSHLLASLNLSSQRIKEELIQKAEQKAIPSSNYDLVILEQITEIFNSFPTNYFYCSMRQDFSGVKGYQFLTLERGAQLFTEILPKSESTFYITKNENENENENLIIHNFYHDSSKEGDKYILAPMTLDNIKRLYERGFRMRILMENSKIIKEQPFEELIFMSMKNNDAEGLSYVIRKGIVFNEDKQVDSCREILNMAIQYDAVEALAVFIEEAAHSLEELLEEFSPKLRTKNNKFQEMLLRLGY